MTFEEGFRRLNDCKFLYLRGHGFGARDTDLRIEVVEARRQGEAKPTPGGQGEVEALMGPARAIEPDDKCAHFTIIFTSYIAVSIINESYAEPEIDEATGPGLLFTTCERSDFRNYLSQTTFATDVYPGPFKHFRLVCLNHVINIACEHDPIILVGRMTKTNILPRDLQERLDAFGNWLVKDRGAETELASVLADINSLPAATISRAAAAIAIAAKLYPSYADTTSNREQRRLHLSDLEQLLRMPDLSYLFLFHYDGRIREAALQRITGALPSAFLFAAVSMRLNDWAAPVRSAALACAKRCFPLTSADIVADAAMSLILRQDSWGRWDVEREAMDTIFARPDVARQFADIICEAQTGPGSRILRHALRNSSIDPYLAQLAESARQPSVRALAVQVIADMRARWADGREWTWVDKSMGKGAMRPKFKFRDVDFAFDRKRVVEAAASDVSAVVRRTALQSLIDHWLGTKEAEEIASALKVDPSLAVRERAAFILSKGHDPAAHQPAQAGA